MGSVGDFVSVEISINASPISEPGFGIPLILSRSAAWTERVRSYSDIDGVEADFQTTTPEWKAAAAMFAQVPAPATIMIGRCALKPTQRWKLTPIAVDSTLYRVVLDGVNINYTSGTGATVAEITDGLKDAFDLAAPTGLTATDGTTYFRVTADAAGEWHNVKVDEHAANKPFASLFSVEQDHDDPGIATDLAAIAVESNAWYAICNLFNSTAEVAAAAVYAEAHAKLFAAATQETEVATLAHGSGTDIAQSIQTSGYDRTAVLFHPDNAAFLDAALLGSRLSYDPGSENWVLASLNGVAAVPLTSTHVANIKAKSATSYYEAGGINVTFGGTSGSGQFLDILRMQDWVTARMQTEVFGLLSGSTKVAYTNAGISKVGSKVIAVLKEAERKGVISDDFTVTLPKIADVTTNDRANRILRNVKWAATLQGAVNSVAIQGVVSV